MDGASAANDITAMLTSFEGGGSVGIYRPVLSFLRPLGDVIPLDDSAGAPSREDTTAAAVKKKMKLPPAAATKKRTKKDELKALADLQLLAERFVPFLSGALKLLPSSLRKCPREEEERAGELFAVFRLVLNCLAYVASCLPGKSSSVHRGRCDLLYHFVTWGKYEQAEEEGLSLLESLRSTLAAPKKRPKGRKTKTSSLLPDSAAEGAKNLAVMVVDAVLGLVGCECKSKTMNATVYCRILLMVEEVYPGSGL